MTTWRPLLPLTLWVIALANVGCGAGSSDTVLASFTTTSSGAEMGVAVSAYGGDSIAQSFQVTTSATTTAVKLTLQKVGTFATGSGHYVQLYIDSDNSDTPSGTPLTNATSATVSVDNISSSSAQQVRFTFATAVTLTASTTYWLRLRASYAVNSTNYIQWMGYDGSSGYSSGKAEYRNGSGTFVTASIGLLRDLAFVVVQ